MKTRIVALPFVAALILIEPARLTTLTAADAVFSGPQIGEKTTPFKVVEVTGENAGQERDPVAAHAGQPTALVFVHGRERSLAPLLRAIDEYGWQRKDALKTEIIFLWADRLEGGRRLKAAATSLQLRSSVGLSVDGIEGPGNYGLNKECLMTIVIAKDNTATANFALVQPGIADAPRVVKAMADVSGDARPPSVEQLTRGGAGAGAGATREAGAMRRDAMRRPGVPAVDLTKFDLNTEAGLRDAVRALVGEVQGLRTELDELKRAAK